MAGNDSSSLPDAADTGPGSPRHSAVALGAVLALHAAALYAVVRTSDAVLPSVSVPLTISFATASEPVRATPKTAPPKPKRQPIPVQTSVAEPLPEPVAHETPPAPEQPAPPQVVPPRFDAAYLNNPIPAYPSISRRLGEHGRTLLRVFVEADGSAREVHVHASSGYPRLDRAARAAVERWQFSPAREGERAVGAWVVVPILFSLNS
jgi:protein TonB